MNRVFDRACRVRILASLAGFVAAMMLSAAGAYAAPLGSVTEFSAEGVTPVSIALGAEGDMWFTGRPGAIGKITSSGKVTVYKTGLQSRAGRTT